MSQRARAVLKFFGLTAATAVMTWLLSWLYQFVCTLVIPGPGFDFASLAINRLAAVSILALVAVVVSLVLVQIMDGCLMLFILIAWGAAALSGIGWLATQVFPGTPVIGLAAQIVYGMVLLAWSIGAYYVFLGDIDFSEVGDEIDAAL